MKLAHSTLVACLVLTGCAPTGVSHTGATPLKITEFRQGLVNFDSNDEPHVYKGGNSFPYVVNGSASRQKRKFPACGTGSNFPSRLPVKCRN
jgi:hypothetical protein